ncbi:hypothetical protein HCC61_24225 [Streptomyces sp. HNM0575]|uniref:hypothetical protein n=1 Tax=Streptomyces sp. HNM0575 TaxID=2716338 RepID=UPI00145CA39E|nr:hypothetical protein [Streptomyces sp. HNM0575]NLU75723.1 hypothetical protein [Streptomyces sp. HNM0575]
MTTGPQHPDDPAARLQFDDPLSMRSADDTDSGWGEARSGDGGTATGSGPRGSRQGEADADLARFLEEKPPHHL